VADRIDERPRPRAHPADGSLDPRDLHTLVLLVAYPGSHYAPAGTLAAFQRAKEVSLMLLALAIILLILWAGGYFAFHLVTAAIHILLLLAVISLILNFVGPWSRRGPVV
jgi:hypothetical protein